MAMPCRCRWQRRRWRQRQRERQWRRREQWTASRRRGDCLSSASCVGASAQQSRHGSAARGNRLCQVNASERERERERARERESAHERAAPLCAIYDTKRCESTHTRRTRTPERNCRQRQRRARALALWRRRLILAYTQKRGTRGRHVTRAAHGMTKQCALLTTAERDFVTSSLELPKQNDSRMRKRKRRAHGNSEKTRRKQKPKEWRAEYDCTSMWPGIEA